VQSLGTVCPGPRPRAVVVSLVEAGAEAQRGSDLPPPATGPEEPASMGPCGRTGPER